jgi:hypothetical protein
MQRIHALASIMNDFWHKGDNRSGVGYRQKHFLKRVTIRSLFNCCSDGVLKVFGWICSILEFWLFLKFFSFRPEVEHHWSEDSRRRLDGIRRLQSPTGCWRVIDCSLGIRIWNILSVFSLRSKENRKNVEIRPKNFFKKSKT